MLSFSASVRAMRALSIGSFLGTCRFVAGAQSRNWEIMVFLWIPLTSISVFDIVFC